MHSVRVRHVAAAAAFVALAAGRPSTLTAQSAPALTFSTYFGGVSEDRAGGVAVDAQGNIYVTGMTNLDVFVMKLTPAGDQVLYKTVLGGSSYEEPAGIAVDAVGNAYVVGTTYSWDFPTINAMQPSRRGNSDAFIVKLSPLGDILYSTYFGGRADETAGGIAVDPLGRVYVSGQTFSPDFPAVNAFQSTLRGNAAFKTTDGGGSWNGLSGGLLTIAVTAFAIDPNDTSTVYAGTWVDGVFKSTDGGATWTATGPELPTAPVNALAVDAWGTVYAANSLSIYASYDGGASWTDGRLWDNVTSIAVDQADGAVYATVSGSYYNPGVFKSVDLGGSWIDTGLPAGADAITVSSSIVYAATDSGVAKSAAGNGWQMLTGISEPVLSVAANPADANDVYAGTYNGLLHTVDGGASWAPVFELYGAPVFRIAIARSSPSTIYVLTGSGPAMTDDAGASWRATGPNQMFAVAIDPLVPTTVYAGMSVGSDAFVARLGADGRSVEYSTYLGGTSYEWPSDVAIDAAGAAYIVGTTQSTDFPVRNPYQASAGGLADVFVAKLSDTGALAYATYLGSYGSEYNPRVAVDTLGQAHVTGLTRSLNYPVANAFQPSHGGGYLDAFVTTLNAAGNGLVFSTFLGGSGMENDGTQNRPVSVAVGPSGETIVVGATQSAAFPTRNPVRGTFGGGESDAFVTTFDAAGQLQFSTYLGGSGGDHADRVAVDPTGAVIVAGATTSVDFPLRHALQLANAGDADVFVARIGEAQPDRVPPSIAIAAPQAIDYLHTDAIAVSFTASDDDSGVAAGSPSAALDGAAVSSSQSLPPLGLALGSHTLVVSALDNAGNPASQTVQFRVKATIDSLIAAVNILTAQGQISSSTSRGLLGQLADAQKALAAGRVTAARSSLVDFENKVKSQSGKSVAPSAAQLLVSDTDYVLGTL